MKGLKILRCRINKFKNQKRDSMEQQKSFDFQALPSEMKQRVATLLSASDTLHMMQTCKSMFYELGLSKASSPLTDRASTGKHFEGAYRTGDQPECFGAIVPKDTERLHSMAFECNWVDQGWGNRKGRIIVVAQDRPTYLEASDLQALPFADGTIVSRSPIAPHHTARLTLLFYPKPDKLYQLWCIVGGGGGHKLHVQGMALNRLGFGNNATDYIAFQFEVESYHHEMRPRSFVVR